MNITLTPEQLALRDDIRDYMARLMTPALLAELQGEQREGGGPEHRKALKQMGADGWVVRSWPREYGGQDAGPIEQYIFCDEVIRAGFPYPFLTTDGVGPVLADVASEEIRHSVVDPILRDWQASREYIPTYPAGTWGPRESNRLFERDDQFWRNEI